ncbi:hypothetical protein HK100_002547 [Physocladia obscura]|uniref:Uncharacterized protein n=1 Tax=Physocladia obscura TaxID=109957 RepID=A0AAD5XE56_9FUNG|nr:hypothetical protein HK100_002547 [Physocladia obscura]
MEPGVSNNLSIPPEYAGIIHVSPRAGRDFQQSLDLALETTSKLFACDYYLAISSKITVTKANNFSFTEAKILADVLNEYSPSVASFATPNQATTKSVDVLLGFDTSIVLFHSSVVSFFISKDQPQFCRGDQISHECYSFLCNAFSAFAFRESSLQIEALQITSSTHKPPGNYSQFLESGFHEKYPIYGAFLKPFDIWWHPVAKTPKPSPSTVLSRVSLFYNPNHPLLKTNSWLLPGQKLSYSPQPIFPQKLYIHIHIFTSFERTPRFNTLFESINNAHRLLTTAATVSITIHIDAAPVSKHESLKSAMNLKSLRSKHGHVKLRVGVNSVNARFHGRHGRDAADAWIPLSQSLRRHSREFAVFLNDEIVTTVSPHFLEFSIQMIDAYFRPHSNSSDNFNDTQILRNAVAGVSLCPNPTWDFVNNVLWDPPKQQQKTPYLLQYPCEPAMLLSAESWMDFVEWKLVQKPWLDPLVPNSMTNGLWPRDSWVKAFFRFMVETGRTLIYPNLHGDFGIIDYVDQKQGMGVHVKKGCKTARIRVLDLKKQLKKRAIGEEYLTDDIRFLENVAQSVNDEIRFVLFKNLTPPPLETLPFYNAYFQHSTTNTLTKLGEKITSFDTCTM